MSFSKTVNFILTWTLSFLHVIKHPKWLHLARRSPLSLTAAENSYSKWITSVFNKNVNIYLRCEERALHFNNETFKSWGLRETGRASVQICCYSAPDSEGEQGEGRGGDEVLGVHMSTEKKKDIRGTQTMQSEMKKTANQTALMYHVMLC